MDECLDGQAWSLTGTTGTMAAALAQDALVFAMGALATDATRPNIPPPGPLEIEGLQVVFTAIIAATVPLTAGRRLQLFKGTNSTMPTGGTQLTPRPKRTKDQSATNGLIGNIARISTTAGLTAGAFTRDTVPLWTFDLLGLGAAGARAEFNLDELINGESLWLDPGEILVISSPVAFDAALTWQLTVNVDYRVRDTL